MIIMKRSYHLFLSILGAAMLGLPGCTAYDTPPPVEGEMPEEGNLLKVEKKVLWINLDGAVGGIVRENTPQNLSRIMANSKVIWKGLGELREYDRPLTEEDPVNWMSMVTGVSVQKHQVRDQSYLADFEPDPSKPDTPTKVYSNVFTRIKDHYPMAQTVCITPWKRLNTNLLAFASDLVTSTGDEDSFRQAGEYLSTEDPTILLVSFKGMLDAGKSGGFKSDNAAYLDALRTIDGYIGSLLDSVKNREDAYYEDWLVIVSSGYGGNEDGDYTRATDASRDLFALFHFPYYDKTESETEVFEGAYVAASNLGVAVDNLPLPGGTVKHPVFSPYANKEFTTELIMRFLPNEAANYNSPGWSIQFGKNQQGPEWGIYFQENKRDIRLVNGRQPHNYTIWHDNFWHNMVFGMNQNVIPMTYFGYADGVRWIEAPTETSSWSEWDKGNLQLGSSGIKLNRYIAAIRIWHKALSEEEIARYAGRVDISESDPNHQYLVGDWRFESKSYDAETMSIRNKAMPDRPFVFQQPLTFHSFINAMDKSRPGLENTLYVPQILYWLGIPRPAELDGTTFLDQYQFAEEWREWDENEL
jgi:hypothetical protein